ncbi:MAG: imidazole glycerol phosphate synthase subunit HisH [Ferruginibacter sp.]
MIGIVDYGVGNIASIKNMLDRAGAASFITETAADIEKAGKLILPGVGAFDTCVEKLQQTGFVEILNKKVLEEKIPLLGICVGMQLLFRSSEEGKLNGLGWIKGENIRFKHELFRDKQLKIPHMGWTDVSAAKQSALLADMFEEPRFYFVHSYHAKLEDPGDALLMAEYGYGYAAAVEHKNIVGVQFHPEKSHKYGLKLLENFAKNY